MGKKRQTICHTAAVLSAAVLAVTALPAIPAGAVNYNTWTGYVLRGSGNQYLTVSSGEEGEGAAVQFCEADGAAFYNTWYFTETDYGITVKSALSEGQYYLAENGSELYLSTTPGIFNLEEDGTLSAFRSGVENPVYGTVTPEAVTNLQAGDMNQDGILNGMDLTLLRQVMFQNPDFVQKAIGDLNGNGWLDSNDAALLQQYLLGNGVTFAEIQMPSDTLLSVTPPVTTEEPPMTTTLPAETIFLPPDVSTQAPEETSETTNTTTAAPMTTESTTTTTVTTTEPVELLDMSAFPSEYQYAADWIWEHRIDREQSTARRNTIFDQIVAGNGTINYVVRWQSYKTVTLEQRQQFEQLVDQAINDWAQWLVGWDGWEYDHIEVNIVGWAVLDKSCLLDLQPDEVVYDNLIEAYDSTYDTSNGVETIPDKLPSAPLELSRMEHWADASYEYPGGLDKRFDMYLWATQGFPPIGGCGGDWGQRLSDDAYLNMLDGTGLHVLEHEIGHGFGMTDFYGEEGANDGFPPGGFPGGGTSIMMAGSATEIKDFDGWMLRYMWSKIKDEDGRF